jgi:hypothetical protein
MAQDKQLDIRINYSGSNNEVTAAITVTVYSEKPDFTFYLMTNDPVKGEVLMESKPERKNTYTFKNVKPGSYFVKIADGDGKLYGKTVRINAEN